MSAPLLDLKVRFNSDTARWEACRRAQRTMTRSTGQPFHKPEYEVVVAASDLATFREALVNHMLMPLFEQAKQEVDAAIEAAMHPPRP